MKRCPLRNIECQECRWQHAHPLPNGTTEISCAIHAIATALETIADNLAH